MTEEEVKYLMNFNYGKVAEEIKSGIVVVSDRKILLIPYSELKNRGNPLTGEVLLSMCHREGKSFENESTIIELTTLSE